MNDVAEKMSKAEKKLREKQEKAQTAAYDLFQTMSRLGVWHCHLVIGSSSPADRASTGEFEELLLTGLDEAGMSSDVDAITITLQRKPSSRSVEISVDPPDDIETTDDV